MHDLLAPVRLEVIESHGLQRDEEGWEHYAYDVRLTRGDESMRLPYRMGTALTDPPTAGEVLECVLSDASSAEESFDEWCATFDYDTDSRKAYATWEAVRAQTEQLRTLLGNEFDSAVHPQDEDPGEVAARLTRDQD